MRYSYKCEFSNLNKPLYRTQDSPFFGDLRNAKQTQYFKRQFRRYICSRSGAVSTVSAAEKKDAQPAGKNNVYDVIVLGAGPAGLVTAIAAKQAGAKKVVVFEKRDRPDGNAIFALGSVCGWGSRHQKEHGIKDTAEDFYAMMMDVSKQMGDKALNRTYTDNIPAAIDWLEQDIGVKFGKIRPMPYPRLGRTCRVDGRRPHRRCSAR